MLKRILLSISIITLFSIDFYAQNALDFDGTNDYVQTTYSGITGSSARTIEAWIKTTANALPVGSGGTGQKVIVDYGTFVTGGRFTLNLLWSNSIRIEVGGNGLSGTLAVNDGVWHHVAVVYNPLATNDYSLYIDGVLNVSGNLTVTTSTSTGNVVIGQRIDGNGKFDGAIDEVRIWNVARTASEIANNMNSEFCVIPTTLKAYYKFNQGIASGTNSGLTTLNDNSGNNNNGTLTNFSLSGSSSNWVSGASLTQGSLTGGTTNISGCIPYTTSGNQILNASGTYPDTLVAASGCDSSYTINFTALASSSSSITTTECDYYFSPSGGVLDSTGIFYDTLVNAIGCDSIITINLTINNTTGSNITTSSCNSYTSPAGNIYTTSGTYVDTFQNTMGCDSLITVNLTIINGYYVTLNEVECSSYTSPSGKIWTTSGTYLDTVATGTGCDSLFTINLTINATSSTTITETACDEYISDNGNSYITSGTYTEVVSNSLGCDSVITLNLTIKSIDNSVTINGSTLTAVATGLAYRWLDCNLNYAPISGGNQQSFTPSSSGNYAVKITDGSCIDTSICNTVSVVGIQDELINNSVRFAPNPVKANLTITSDVDLITKIELFDISGKRVFEKGNLKNTTVVLDLSHLNSGIYIANVYSSSGMISRPIVLE